MPLRNPACEMLTAGIASAVQTSERLFLPSKLRLALFLCHRRAAVLVLFSPAVLPFLVWHPLPFLSQVHPDHDSCCLLYKGIHVGWGAWQWVLLKGERWGAGRLVIVMGEAIHRRLQSSKSGHSALKSADTAFSPHPENDLICSWWLVITAVNSYLWF